MPEPTTQEEVKAVATKISSPAQFSPTVWFSGAGILLGALAPVTPEPWGKVLGALAAAALGIAALLARQAGINAAATTAGMTPTDVREIARDAATPPPATGTAG